MAKAKDKDLSGRRIAFLVADEGTEQVELREPWQAALDAVANPDKLRTVPEAVAFARKFVEDGKPVAAICHGPWTLIETGTLGGRTLTSWPSLQTDLRNAGANWVDQEVAVCTSRPSTLVTSRKPDDLKAFCATYIEHIR